jgi:hypothetical protein
MTLTFGTPFEGIVQANTPPHTFVFPGAANDLITVNLFERSPTTRATACGRVLSPNGETMLNRCGSMSISAPVRLSANGTHRAEVYEDGNDDVLAYDLTLACSGVCPLGGTSGGSEAPAAGACQ